MNNQYRRRARYAKNKQDKILKYLGIKIKKLDKNYIIDGEINPLISLTVSKQIERVDKRVIKIDRNSECSIIFEDTRIEVKIPTNRIDIAIRRYEADKGKVYIFGLGSNNRGIDIYINKHGKARVKEIKEEWLYTLKVILYLALLIAILMFGVIKATATLSL